MTMLSFRVDDLDAAQVELWTQRLGIARSDLLREALRQYLARLASERDAEAWQRQPMAAGEMALNAIEDWGPAEDWADWADATR
jgi:antitoxin MazE2